ncbi:F-box only protein 15-like [Xyrauchen texanus]|uniref:F-box only protein 15-like n=1 Tax=Xyrauchen texanus TaxID=154827 RepID=UPI002241D5E8|nr:F-box only protein 15-like [Xyrauchen texanus]
MATLSEFLQSLRQSLNNKVQQTTYGDAQDGVTEDEIAQFEGARRLPSEIIQKILSFLDASSLFNVSFVNKQFHDLANNNALWYALYAGEIEKKMWRPQVGVMKEGLSTASVQEKPVGYFKKLLLKHMAGYRHTMWKMELRYTNPHTGMPVLTEQVLRQLVFDRRLHIQWEITLTQKNGCTTVYEQTHTFFEDSSVTVCWIHGIWPKIYNLASIQLHGIMTPTLLATGDRWRSLIHKTKLSRSVQWSFRSDTLVKLLQFDKGISVGVWRGNWKIAFIMVNLHFHKLIERSLLGSRFCPYMPTEDNSVDPDSGHHGYSLHIALHNPVRQIMCGHFPRLLNSRGKLQHGHFNNFLKPNLLIEDNRRFSQTVMKRFLLIYNIPVTSEEDYLRLDAIDFTDVSKHIPVGKINLPWQAKGLQGAVEHCCMMTLTVLDEGQRPFWCVSSPVKMAIKHQRLLRSGCEGKQFYIFYEDAEGKVKMVFEWMEEIQHHFLVQLIIIFPTAKVKKQVGGEC